MTKYKEYVLKMLEENKQLFDNFRKVHDAYQENPNLWQKKYNDEGERVLEVVREYENRVCANTERGKYIKFSGGLAEKFQAEVRKFFPMIDHVGIKVVVTKKINLVDTDSFVLKKLL